DVDPVVIVPEVPDLHVVQVGRRAEGANHLAPDRGAPPLLFSLLPVLLALLDRGHWCPPKGNAEIRSPPRPAPQGPARAAGGEEEAQGEGEGSPCPPASTLRWGAALNGPSPWQPLPMFIF